MRISTWSASSSANQDPQRTNVARVGPRYAWDPVTRFSAHVGYEDNRYPLSDYAGAVYGVGIEWQPTERTKVVANWEHRFFGSSYLFTFDHRTPLSVWNVSASRLISSYPQQLGTLAAGGSVPALLDQLFVSRIPDPTQRQQAVNNFIDSRGLPSELSSPVNVYTQQITLNQNLSATMGLLGSRNSLFVTVYRYDTQPISGSGVILPPVFGFGNDNTQLGVNVVWSHNLTPLTVLNLAAYALSDRGQRAAGRYDRPGRRPPRASPARFRRTRRCSRACATRSCNSDVPASPTTPNPRPSPASPTSSGNGAMYEAFFGLTGKPFQLNPDPSFYYGSRGHKRAFAYLEYGLYQSEGFIVITGEIGAGKTTIVRNLLEQLDPAKVVAAQIVSTQLDADDLLRAIGVAFGLPVRSVNKAVLLASIEAFLCQLATEKKRALLVVDEAQNLTQRAMEELRMLSNFQFGDQALLQSFLVGQPELRQLMQKPELQQLRQRVIASYHLGPARQGGDAGATSSTACATSGGRTIRSSSPRASTSSTS